MGGGGDVDRKLNSYLISLVQNAIFLRTSFPGLVCIETFLMEKDQILVWF